ncbi:MAG TPA: hypothetical protein DEA22_03720 [Blastocatellia bacterium]|nr:hypothetical protein [Blastocatellia bacterium]
MDLMKTALPGFTVFRTQNLSGAYKTPAGMILHDNPTYSKKKTKSRQLIPAGPLCAESQN